MTKKVDIGIGHTAFSSSSRKFNMFCCLMSALFFRDEVNVCGVHPTSLFHAVELVSDHHQDKKQMMNCSPNLRRKYVLPSFDPTVL